MPVLSAMQIAVREGLLHIAANAAGAAAGRNPEFLHQLRVGARRLRAALHASRRLWRKEDVRALRRCLRKLAAATGPVRDWDVQYRTVAPGLRARAAAQRRSAHAALRRALPLVSRLSPPRARDVAPLPLPAHARRVLDRLDRKIRRRAARVDWARPEERHALRVRLRRLRYTAELLQGAFPGADAEPLVGALKDLQGILGELNDIEIGRRLRAELGARARPARAREQRLLGALPSAWRRFATAPRFWRKMPL